MNYYPYIHQLHSRLEKAKYKGYDPYDALNMPLPWSRMGRILPILCIQIVKRLPWNLRPLLGIKKGYNPKAMGLLLHACCVLYRKTGENTWLNRAAFFFNWLLENTSEGYPGLSWGYNFNWKSPIRDLPAYTPSAVVTAFVCRGIKAYYDLTGDQRAAQALHAAAEFVHQALPRVEDETGISFSYTPLQTEVCYNASLLAAEVLWYSHSLQSREEYAQLAARAGSFVVHRQNRDGSWAYSEKPDTGERRSQIDFHQGFVLESIQILYTGLGNFHPRVQQAIAAGLHFYRSYQFESNGRPKYRLPKGYPADIHHVAQGILTFTRLDSQNRYLGYQHTIANWAIKHMYSRRKNHFYYRKYWLYTNRIEYIRWGQSWMLLALAEIDG